MGHLRLEGVRQEFGDTVALDGMDLSLARGELVALLGPSGCGKTTALRIVAGFQRPSAGRVVLDDRDITALAPSRRDLGMVFQAYSLFPHLTAAQNIAFGLRVRRTGRAERDRRVRELLELTGLHDAGGRYPHQLSGGMQQRVALARALATEPRVLLLDEPLSALDALVRVQLRDEIRRLQRDMGITTIFVTHDQEEALSVADRVAVLNRGRIEQLGAPDVIYRQPRTPFVAEFIGTMNRLPGHVGAGAHVAVNGHHLRVADLDGRVAGDAVMVLVRPEALSLTPANGRPDDGALTGTVTARQFLGAVTRVRATTASGLELRADVPSGRADWLTPGAPVLATFDPSDARVLGIE